jgi:hypothetical protein
MSSNTTENTAAAEERKRKRLEAWRVRQQQQTQQKLQPQIVDPPKAKVSISLSKAILSKKKKLQVVTKSSAPVNNKNTFASIGFGDDEDEYEGDDSRNNNNSGGVDRNNRKKRPLDLFLAEIDSSTNSAGLPTTTSNDNGATVSGTQPQRRRRWDNPAQTSIPVISSPTATASNGVPPTSSSSGPKDSPSAGGIDVLDQFMENLESSFVSTTDTQTSGRPGVSVVSSVELDLLNSKKMLSSGIPVELDAVNDTAAEYDREEQERRALIEALKQQGPVIRSDDVDNSANGTTDGNDDNTSRPAQLAAEVKSEKSRREERLRELEFEAEQARKLSERNEPEFGRYLFDDTESGVMEEAERNLDAAKAAPDALTVLAELNKKKEIRAVDHASIQYMPFTANLYRVPRALANLKHEDVIDRRAKLKIRVRGHGAPAPIQTFEQAGLSELILSVLRNHNIQEPFPVQAQCIPCIMGA